MFTLTPDGIRKYRQATHTKGVSVGATKHCQGSCKRRRSTAQFDGGDICKQCKLRMPKK